MAKTLILFLIKKIIFSLYSIRSILHLLELCYIVLELKSRSNILEDQRK